MIYYCENLYLFQELVYTLGNNNEHSQLKSSVNELLSQPHEAITGK